MAQCKFCGQEIDWIRSPEGKPVSVDPDPVFVIEGGGQDTFLDDMGVILIGRQAKPEEECPELYVGFVPHRRTCPWAANPAARRVEHDVTAGGLAPAT